MHATNVSNDKVRRNQRKSPQREDNARRHNQLPKVSTHTALKRSIPNQHTGVCVELIPLATHWPAASTPLATAAYRTTSTGRFANHPISQ